MPTRHSRTSRFEYGIATLRTNGSRSNMRILIFAAMACVGIATASAAEPGEAYRSHQHAALFLGGVVERKKSGREKEIGVAIGYEF